jgi:uncharacterized membrane protein
MLAIILGLGAALLYGGSDFGGGLASRRLGSLTVNVVGSSVGVAFIWSALGLSGGPAPTTHAVVWGLLSGLGGGVGTMMLYRGLARGQMSVVGPVSAVGAAVVPVVVGVVLGDRPGLLGAAGVLVALPAIALVAASGSVAPGALRSSLFDALTAGTAFGLMFVGLAQAGGHAGLWPVATEQTSSLVLLLVVAAVTRTSLKVNVRSLGLPVLAGVTGSLATLLYFAATLQGMLATVAIVTSLYPGVTVLLARIVTHERFRPVQRVGLGLCAVAVLAIAIS